MLWGIPGREGHNFHLLFMVLAPITPALGKHLPLWARVGHAWWLLQWDRHRLYAGSTCNGNLRLSSWYQGTSAGLSQHRRYGMQLAVPAVGDLRWARLSERSPRSNEPVVSPSRLHSSMEVVSHLCWRLCGKFSHFYRGRWGILKAWECLHFFKPTCSLHVLSGLLV